MFFQCPEVSIIKEEVVSIFMQMNIREAASLMNVSEKTVYRWIEQRNLPAFRINAQYSFNRAELMEWATLNHVSVSTDMFSETLETGAPSAGLAEAIQAGGIHYHIEGADRESVLNSIIGFMPLPEEMDRSFLFQVLIARESLGSTAIGDGIAIPHARNPIVLHIKRPVISVCFLDHPIEFGALDGKPVHTFFTILSPTTSVHLNLLSRLAFALRSAEFAALIAARGKQDDIIACASSIDGLVSARDAGSLREEHA